MVSQCSNQLASKKMTVHVTNGSEAAKPGDAILCKRNDGFVYLDGKPSDLYEFIGIEIGEPQYEQVTTTRTVGTEQSRQKRTGRFAGATIGTLVAPGIGTAIGALHGTGNSKGTTSINHESVTTTEMKPVDPISTIYLVSFPLCRMIEIRVQDRVESMENLGNMLASNPPRIDSEKYKDSRTKLLRERGFLPSAKEDRPQSDNPYEEVKQLKELLDIGAITEDEFNKKKKEILGL